MKNILFWLFACCLVFDSTDVHADYWAQATFIKGTVTVRSGGTGEEKPLTLGSLLKEGDVISISENGRASFLLHDGSVLVGKTRQNIILNRKKDETGVKVNTVAKNLVKSFFEAENKDPMMKHVGGLRSLQNNIALVPASTTVRADKDIVFLWLPRPPVTKYTLVVMGENDYYQEYATSENTFFRLRPGTLEPGMTYSWEIHDGAQDVTIVPLGSALFSVAAKEITHRVNTMKKDIATMYARSDAKEDSTPYFLLYQLYLRHGFSIEALLTVDRMLEVTPDNTHILKLKQDLQRTMNLHDSDITLLKSKYESSWVSDKLVGFP